ncbi:hypothetical protein SKAU_G00034650 [Synaphobranchus kaupii]|uniref:Uncharacterized protein n=1 Tax=Synaphobranchus kaupii TaxID=118154 RepID=A0A9Q1GF00_SYNKA|nr:hypothetical protein SKAU_G00034650 [Synaphobranchus kaupii]
MSFLQRLPSLTPCVVDLLDNLQIYNGFVDSPQTAINYHRIAEGAAFPHRQHGALLYLNAPFVLRANK